MSSQDLLDFDSLWDYSNPGQTEINFHEFLLQVPKGTPSYLELLTQIARSQGFNESLRRHIRHSTKWKDCWEIKHHAPRFDTI